MSGEIAKLRTVRWSRQTGRDGEYQLLFTVHTGDLWKARSCVEALMPTQELELVIREPKKTRSLDQNAYFWALVGEIAAVTLDSNREIYKALLEAYTPPTWLTFPAEAQKLMLKEPFRVIREQWRKGDVITALCWRSSKYLTTKEFSRLLDGTLEEARQVGIDPEAVRLGLLENDGY